MILLVNATTRLPVVIPARDASTIPARFGTGLTAVLATLQVPTNIISAELQEMREVVFSTTESRSVLGTMNDFANHIEWALEEQAGVTVHALRGVGRHPSWPARLRPPTGRRLRAAVRIEPRLAEELPLSQSA